MELISYDFDPALSGAYAQFRKDLYAHDENWHRASRQDIEADFRLENAFYRDTGNRHRHFLLRSGHRVMGHVSVFFNQRLSVMSGERTGFIGQFEFVNDLSAAHETINTACRWLAENCSVRRIWGPVNFDIWHEYRLMTKGFERMAFAGEPYNSSYYPSLFEAAGFRPIKLWHSFDARIDKELRPVFNKAQSRRDSFLDRGFSFESFDASRASEQIPALHCLIMKALKGFLGYVPLSLEEFMETMGSRRSEFDPSLVIFARDAERRLAGFVIGHTDKTLECSGSESERRGICFLGGANPDLGHANLGIGTALFAELTERFQARGITSLVQAIVSEGNPTRGLFAAVGARPTREYALYHRAV